MFTFHDACAQLRNERMNVSLEFVLTEDGHTLVNARGTYWRGSEHSDRMYLVAAATCDEAIVRLACAWEDRTYTKVDWRARLYRPGTYGVRVPAPIRPDDMDRAEKDQDDRYPYTRT